MRSLARAVTWQWKLHTPYPWLRDFLPLIALAAACLTMGIFNGVGHPATLGSAVSRETGVFADPAYVAIFLYRATGNVMLAVMLVVLSLSAAAYWLRQKVRLAYGALELCVGICVAGLAVAQMARDSVAPDLSASAWNQDLFRLATGIYFVIRGMTNTKDGIELRPRRDAITTVVDVPSQEPASP